MPTELITKISSFKEDSNSFVDILNYFESKINYLSYSLKYPEASTDLTIFLYELLPKLNLDKFKCDDEILHYIKKCLQNKAIKLSYKVTSDKNAVCFNSNEEIIDLLDNESKNDDFSNILFNDLISLLKPKQKQMVLYKFYYDLSDSEIAKIFKISRQAVNKSLKKSLNTLKAELSREKCLS